MIGLGLGIGLTARVDPLGALLNASEFYAPLTHSLVLTRGTGDPTFTRATKAWEFGYAAAANAGADQVLMEIASGTARFGGARYNAGTWYNTYADGSAISASTLLGYHAEGARTNNLLYSRDLTQAAWAAKNITPAKTATGIDGAANSATTLTAGAADATILQTLTLAAATRSSSSYVKRRTGTGNVYMTRVGENVLATQGVPWDFSSDAVWGTKTNLTISGGVCTLAPSATLGWGSVYFVIGRTYRVTYTINSITPGSSSIRAYIGSSAGTARTTTGTFTENITYAAGAAAFYIFTGAGFVTGEIDNVIISEWYDITSQINSSTWTRVKIENSTVLNPQIGFKIATSGDAIDVDCVQDEAGAFISSPIITTSAAVTRNADVLTYATASNWSDTAGWVAASVYKPDWSYVAGGIIGSATNGLLPLTTNTGAKAYDSTNTVNGPTGSPSGTVKAAMTWGSGALQVAANGTAGTAGSYDGSWGLATIGIGTSAGGMYIKNAYVAQTALTSTQLAQVTT